MTEILIVGGGAFGLSTALALASGPYRGRASRIVVIDRSADPPEVDAASSDINKIVRSDYADPTYAGIAQKALDEWTNNSLWKPYFFQSGIVVSASKLGDHGESYVRGCYEYNVNREAKEATPLPPKMLDTQEQFAEAMGSIGAMPPMSYWNKRSGWGWSTGAMKELAKACGEAGVHFEQGLVNGLIIEDGDVRGARTNDGRVHLASKLVILAAGSWSPAVFPEISEKLTATGQVLAKIQLTSEEAARYAKTPVFLDMQTGFYVFPPTENNVVKLAIHQHGWTNEQPSLSDEHSKVSLPRTRHFGGDPSENIPREAVKDLREQLSRVYPELAAKPFSDTRLCWYCDTSDGDFLISYHDKYPSLFLATGGSGHAFKLCVQAIDRTLPEPMKSLWSYNRVRQYYKPDRSATARHVLHVDSFASKEELAP